MNKFLQDPSKSSSLNRWKLEFNHVEENDTLIVLTAKTYGIFKNEYAVKSCAKGIQQRNRENNPLFTLEAFRNALFNNYDTEDRDGYVHITLPLCTNTGFIRRNSQMITYRVKKASLSSFYVKHKFPFAFNCLRHCFPWDLEPPREMKEINCEEIEEQLARR